MLARAAQFWRDNKLALVMFGIVAGGHYTWRAVQDQREFVPKGEPRVEEGSTDLVQAWRRSTPG